MLPEYADKQFGKPVTLVFMQPYARVRFLFIYSYTPDAYTLNEKEFKPTNGSKIARQGVFTVTYPLDGSKTHEEYTVVPATGAYTGALDAFEEDYEPDNDNKVYPADCQDNGWYYVLPAENQGSYTLSVKLTTNASPVTTIVPAGYMKWLPGYQYTYIFKITQEGGVEMGSVQSAFTQWTVAGADSKTVYNW